MMPLTRTVRSLRSSGRVKRRKPCTTSSSRRICAAMIATCSFAAG